MQYYHSIKIYVFFTLIPQVLGPVNFAEVSYLLECMHIMIFKKVNMISL